MENSKKAGSTRLSWDLRQKLDYTALDSTDYRAQVIRQLDSMVSADRAYSFQQQFADCWYELNNPDPGATHTSVTFQTALSDFPPNVQNLSIGQVLLYFVPGGGGAFQIQPKLTLTPPGSGAEASVGGTVSSPPDGNPLGAVFSTRRGNASAWMPMIGMSPAGSWTLDIPNAPNGQNVFQTGQVKDILFVITYNGNTPAWAKSLPSGRRSAVAAPRAASLIATAATPPRNSPRPGNPLRRNPRRSRRATERSPSKPYATGGS